MRSLALMGMALLLLGGCGDSNGAGSARTAGELCDEVCGWPDACFAELGVPLQDAECVQSCEASVEVVGLPCLQAINNTVACLGTCDFNALTEQQILSCQDEAEGISGACD
ncbi:MAG: hypothetical protein JRG70_13265 [Deltaproteobacteria bacterium]|nr:hypothetical protein [Deltaproteobacteria bacterium]